MPQAYTITSKSLIHLIPLKKVCPHDPKYHQIRESIQSLGCIFPVTISNNGFLLDGHKVCRALEETGHTTVDTIQLNIGMNIDGAWEYHRLLNGHAIPKNHAEPADAPEPSDTIPHQDLLSRLPALTRPGADQMRLKLILTALDDMCLTTRQGIQQILLNVLR